MPVFIVLLYIPNAIIECIRWREESTAFSQWSVLFQRGWNSFLGCSHINMPAADQYPF